MHSGRGREEHSDKCASENMNMKIYCDPGAELFSSTPMPSATSFIALGSPSSYFYALV